MSTSQAHRGTAPIFEILTVDQTKRLAELQGDPALADRVAELAEKANKVSSRPPIARSTRRTLRRTICSPSCSPKRGTGLPEAGLKQTDTATRGERYARQNCDSRGGR